jgi:predicted RecA/RadA family phage recombinase
MTAEATYLDDADCVSQIAGANLASGEILQLADGRAAVVAGLKSVLSGEVFAGRVRGRHNVAAATGLTAAIGDRVYWDASANTAILAASAGDGDFYLGLCAHAKISGELVIQVDLNAEPGGQRGVFSSRVREIDHADAGQFILIDAADNPHGLALVALLGEVSEQPAGSSEDQLIITLFDEDDNAIDTLTTTNTTPDAVGDIIVGATSMFSAATGGVFKKIPAGKAAYAKVTQATAGTPAGKLKVRAVVMPLA